MNILVIDTSNNREITVGLRIDGKEHLMRKKVDYRKAQEVLPLLDRLLRKQHVKLEDLSEVWVNTRLGSFTGVRVGLSVANALGFALKIPVKKMVY